MCCQNRWGWHTCLLVCVTSKLHRRNQLLNRALLIVAILYTLFLCAWFCVCVCVSVFHSLKGAILNMWLGIPAWSPTDTLCWLCDHRNQPGVHKLRNVRTGKKKFKTKFLLTLIDSQVPLLSIMYQAQVREEPVLYSPVLHFMFECNCGICDMQLKTLFMPFFFSLHRSELYIGPWIHREPSDDIGTYRTGMSRDRRYPFTPRRSTWCQLGAQSSSW